MATYSSKVIFNAGMGWISVEAILIIVTGSTVVAEYSQLKTGFHFVLIWSCYLVEFDQFIFDHRCRYALYQKVHTRGQMWWFVMEIAGPGVADSFLKQGHALSVTKLSTAKHSTVNCAVWVSERKLIKPMVSIINESLYQHTTSTRIAHNRVLHQAPGLPLPAYSRFNFAHRISLFL